MTIVVHGQKVVPLADYEMATWTLLVAEPLN